MITIRIPSELKTGGALKVTMEVGQLGFKRSDFYKSGKWKRGQEIYVDEETIKVEFVVSNDSTHIIRYKVVDCEGHRCDVRKLG